MASDGTRLHVAAVTDTDGRTLSFQPSITGGLTDLQAVPLAVDAASTFDLVSFASAPALVKLDTDGTVGLFPIAADGTLGPRRVLVTGADSLERTVVVGSDGGIHLVAAIADHLAYVKRCP